MIDGQRAIKCWDFVQHPVFGLGIVSKVEVDVPYLMLTVHFPARQGANRTLKVSVEDVTLHRPETTA